MMMCKYQPSPTMPTEPILFGLCTVETVSFSGDNAGNNSGDNACDNVGDKCGNNYGKNFGDNVVANKEGIIHRPPP